MVVAAVAARPVVGAIPSAFVRRCDSCVTDAAAPTPMAVRGAAAMLAAASQADGVPSSPSPFPLWLSPDDSYSGSGGSDPQTRARRRCSRRCTAAMVMVAARLVATTAHPVVVRR